MRGSGTCRARPACRRHRAPLARRSPGPRVPAEIALEQLLELPQQHFAQAAAAAEHLLRQGRARQVDVPDWEMDELEALCKVARRNMTALQLLTKGAGGAAATQHFRADWDFSQHKHFPAVSLKRR